MMTIRHSVPAELLGSGFLLPPAEARADFAAAYLRRYATRRDIDEAELAAWGLPVVAGRLSELLAVGEYNELVSVAGKLAAM